MYIQKHLNVPSTHLGYWPRARTARLDREFLWCELDYKRGYDFMTAYKAGPHVRLLNAKTDSDLVAFVNTWGPLSIPDGSPEGKSVLPICDYRLFQRKLEALSSMLHAFQKGSGDKKALLDLLTAEQEEAKNFDTFSTASLFLAIAIESNDPSARQLAQESSGSETELLKVLTEWIARAPVHSVRRAGASLTNKLFSFSARVRIDPQSRGVSLVWDMSNLEEALLWMVCQDALDERLPQVCPECRTTFQPAFRHIKKFCSNECAQRCAAREWQRRRRGRKHRRKGKASSHPARPA